MTHGGNCHEHRNVCGSYEKVDNSIGVTKMACYSSASVIAIDTAKEGHTYEGSLVMISSSQQEQASDEEQGHALCTRTNVKGIMEGL